MRRLQLALLTVLAIAAVAAAGVALIDGDDQIGAADVEAEVRRSWNVGRAGKVSCDTGLRNPDGWDCTIESGDERCAGTFFYRNGRVDGSCFFTRAVP